MHLTLNQKSRQTLNQSPHLPTSRWLPLHVWLSEKSKTLVHLSDQMHLSLDQILMCGLDSEKRTIRLMVSRARGQYKAEVEQ